jgi:hypothetical protein
VLARYRIEFINFHLFRLGALVLGGGVKMAGTGGRFKFYFFTHDGLLQLNRDAAAAQISQHNIDAVFVYGAQASLGYAQAYPAVLGLHPKAATMQIRQKTPLGLIIGMGNVVSHHRLLAGDLTYA